MEDQPEEGKIQDIKDFTDEVLKDSARYIVPEADVDSLSREELEDITLAFNQELQLLMSYLGDRQKETKYPNRLFSRVLMQLGKSQDAAMDRYLEEQTTKEDSNE